MNFSKRADYVRTSEVRELLKLTERPEVISFAGGMPAPELFPIEEMKKVCMDILDKDGPKALQYGTTEGYTPLRAACVKRMAEQGIVSEIDEVIITTGSQQGLDLTGKVFIDEGDLIICESPTYLAAINAFNAYMPRFVEIPMDDNGMIMEELEIVLKTSPDAKFIYTIPDFQNPTGRSMSLERRKKLVELANKYEIVIIEDNPYGELRFDGETIPPVKAFDTENRVVYLSTFSKILSPGIRIGWICAPLELLQKYILFKQGTDLHTSIFTQMQAARFLEMFDINLHIDRIKRVYKHRKEVMLNTIKSTFPEAVKVTDPAGGLFLWAELPPHMSSREVLARCLENDVAFVPGSSFFATGGKENTMRLNFSNMPEERIEEGIKRMAKVLKELL